MATREAGGTDHILPAERANASFDIEVLMKVVAGTRPMRIEQYTHLFDGDEFDSSMDDYESYPELFAKQLGVVWCGVCVRACVVWCGVVCLTQCFC